MLAGSHPCRLHRIPASSLRSVAFESIILRMHSGRSTPVQEKYVDIDGNEWTTVSSVSGWVWRKEILATGATEDSVGRFAGPEDCLRDARSHGLLEGYPMGGDCVQRHDRLWRWRIIGPSGRVTAESPGIYPTERACLANAHSNAVGWDPPIVDHGTARPDEQLHTNIALTARGERRFMSIKAARQRKGVSELVDYVGRIVTETERPVPQIDGHGGSSVSHEEGFATSVMHEALDTGLIVASPDEVLEFFGEPCKLLNVDLTESGWALYRERSTPHLAPEADARDRVGTSSPASVAIRDPHSHAGIHIHANEVKIGTAVGGDVTGDVQGSQGSSAPSPGPFWKRHPHMTIWGVLVSGAIVVLTIVGQEFIERAAGDLYHRYLADIVSTTSTGTADIASPAQSDTSTATDKPSSGLGLQAKP